MHPRRRRAGRDPRATRTQIPPVDGEGDHGMSLSLRWRVLLLSLFLTSGAALATDPPAQASHAAGATAAPAQKPGHAAIASANFLATNAGLEVLAKGGNAFDAAVAVASTLSVVEPESSGLGGGFLAVLRRASDGREVFIDAREVAPAAVDPKDYLNADGSPNRDAALNGPLSAGIPGEPAGLAWLAAHYGKLPLSTSLAPAIRTARDGFKPDSRLRNAIAERADDLKRWPASEAKYFVEGK